MPEPANPTSTLQRPIETIRRLRPGLDIGLCLEERSVFDALGLAAAIGRCNCVLWAMSFKAKCISLYYGNYGTRMTSMPALRSNSPVTPSWSHDGLPALR